MELQEIVDRLSENDFLGVPSKGFVDGGREHFIYLLRAGLNPDSKIVDLGCGVLRVGYWLIHFLDQACYCGIEPHAGRLDIGTKSILEAETLKAKLPRFDTNAEFDTSVFGEKFDFFLAYSIWTHASKPQVTAMLDSFVRDATPDGKFLTSYLPAGWRHPDYQGDSWYGTSHESDAPGCINHSRRWIKSQCERRGLAVRELSRRDLYGQRWLVIKRAESPDHV